MSVFRCTVHRPIAGSTLRSFKSDHLAYELLTCSWSDLNDLRRELRRHRYTGVYILSGFLNGELHVRIGEGAVLWNRLPEHRRTPALSFVRDIHLLRSPVFDKGSVLFFQERLSDLVDQSSLATRVGHPPERLFYCRREELEDQLPYALGLLALAGLTCFGPLSAFDAPRASMRTAL